MFDALYFACRDKLLKQEQTGPVRHAIILLSDGEDNASHVTREEAIDMAQRADAIVYTISTNISGMKGQGDKVLMRIAEATGGQSFLPFSDARRVGRISLDSGRVAQPVRGSLQTGKLHGRWTLSHDRDHGTGQGFESAHAQGILRAEAVASGQWPVASCSLLVARKFEIAFASVCLTSGIFALARGSKLRLLCLDTLEHRLAKKLGIKDRVSDRADACARRCDGGTAKRFEKCQTAKACPRRS